MSEQQDRKDILLRAAFDLLRKASGPGYVQYAPDIVVRYDDANCDGSCLMMDIAIELDIEITEEPMPLGKEQE